ncbi:MAG: DegT/DnrJ/EryC1/StrS family aminotransferase, partial [Nitrospinota bacterium]|nr:DegT/DnrJ/EryC1/StrS family aminotransferase [Nitrospinota bacterium]
MTEKRVVEFFKHNLDDDSIMEFQKVAKGMFITTGPKTALFENKFAEYLGVKHAVGMMSCTHALHLAYCSLGLSSGDEVIVPAFTFAASASAVMHAGGTPVFVDVDPDTGIIDHLKIEAAITTRTKAICPVHLYGVMAPMEEISRIAKKHSLKVIEDGAHCIEGSINGYKPGTLSDAAAFSFYATKNITCGEGGALATNNSEIAEKVKRLRNHGMTKNAIDRFSSDITYYDIQEVGYKSNMNDLQAALLLPQLANIEEKRDRRQTIVDRYNEGLKDVAGIKTPVIPTGVKSALHLYTIRIHMPEMRTEFLRMMREEGVNCSVNYRPLLDLSLFKEKMKIDSAKFPNAKNIGDTTVTLPLYPS